MPSAIRLLLASVLVVAANFSAAQSSTPTSEPEVTIRELDDKTITEYRVNGVLYAIKVTPKAGPVYYLHRADGSELWTRSDHPELLIPSWQIFSW